MHKAPVILHKHPESLANAAAPQTLPPAPQPQILPSSAPQSAASRQAQPALPSDGAPVSLPNAFALQPQGLLIPYGRYPHPKGRTQVINRPIAQALADDFHSTMANGAPIYRGHPDHPEYAFAHRDDQAYGWVADLIPEQSGLRIVPKWSGAGESLLANAHYKFFSPYWSCDPLPEDPSLVAPTHLISVGLTNTPIIQVPPLANAATAAPTAATTQEPIMDPKELAALLGLPAESTPAQITAAITANATALANAKAASDIDAQARTAELATLNAKVAEFASQTAALANSRAELIADHAIAAGKITQAQRPEWIADLVADFPAKSVVLANMAPVLSTAPIASAALRSAPQLDRFQQQVEYVAEVAKEANVSLVNAWPLAAARKPALFTNPA